MACIPQALPPGANNAKQASYPIPASRIPTKSGRKTRNCASNFSRPTRLLPVGSDFQGRDDSAAWCKACPHKKKEEIPMGKLRFEPNLEAQVSPWIQGILIETPMGTRIELKGLTNFHQISSLVCLLEDSYSEV
jgi:hypothetical protein